MLSTLQFFLLILAHLCSVAAICQVLLTKTNPRSALGWTALLFFLPVIGLVVYLTFGISRAQSKAEKIMKRLAHIAQHYPHSPQINATPEQGSPQAATMADIGRKLAGEPLCSGNAVKPLHNGDEAYPAMLEAICNAKNHVFLGTYIFNYGHAAIAFIRALTAARRRGVDVRVLVDGIGALYSWRKPWKILASLDVPVTRFRPPSLFPPNFSINLRCHRKSMICDARAFTGGMNIADGNIMNMPEFLKKVAAIEAQYNISSIELDNLPPLKNHKKHQGIIQDVQFQCDGPIVAELRKAFLLNWSFCTNVISPLPALDTPRSGHCDCRVIVDGPGNDADALNDILCGALNMARHKARIMTPYFIPTQDLTAALRGAAQRGVDVRVILPAQNNLAYMTWATQKILPPLMTAGVRIWYQKPPFAHTKLFSMDNFYTLIGSANLDARSLRLNFEMNTEIYNPDIANRVCSFIESRMLEGREIQPDFLKKQNIFKKLRNSACWLFSPYL